MTSDMCKEMSPEEAARAQEYERKRWALINAAPEMLKTLEVIAEALKEPDGGSYWPAREYLDKYDKFHEDLDGSRVLLQVAQVAIRKAKGEL